MDLEVILIKRVAKIIQSDPSEREDQNQRTLDQDPENAYFKEQMNKNPKSVPSVYDSLITLFNELKRVHFLVLGNLIIHV